MKIFPAIDLYEKKAVRLYKGDYREMTVYSEDPLSVAKDFEAKGAEWIHMVDLEGARDGTMPNLCMVEKIARNTSLSVELGGGIRSIDAIDRCFAAGVKRVILGTAAVTDPEFLRLSVSLWGDKIAVGADVKDGCIAIRGWQETAPLTLDAFLEEMVKIGVCTVICTDISKDGAMKGANVELYAALCRRYPLQFVASGGVSDLKDIQVLAGMGLYAAILGKAYYTGAVDLEKAIEVAAK